MSSPGAPEGGIDSSPLAGGELRWALGSAWVALVDLGDVDHSASMTLSLPRILDQFAMGGQRRQ